jgi:uncharacterized protein (TIGR03067 family)
MFAKALLFSAVTFVPAAPAQAAQPERGTLQGAWPLVSGNVDGKPLVQDGGEKLEKVIVKGNALQFHVRKNGKIGVAHATFTLPAQGMDVSYVLFDPARPVLVRAAYRLDGDRLTVCYPYATDAPRPSDVRPGLGKIVIVLERERR